jgi:hypothetical protein
VEEAEAELLATETVAQERVASHPAAKAKVDRIQSLRDPMKLEGPPQTMIEGEQVINQSAEINAHGPVDPPRPHLFSQMARPISIRGFSEKVAAQHGRDLVIVHASIEIDLVFYMRRNQFATARGSNLTQVPILKHGMRPAFANLKIVMRDTVNISASSSAVSARPIRSIRSARLNASGASGS